MRATSFHVAMSRLCPRDGAVSGQLLTERTRRLDELLDPVSLRAILEDAVLLEVGADDGAVGDLELSGDIVGAHAGVDEDRDGTGRTLYPPQRRRISR